MQSHTMHSASPVLFNISHWICTFPIYTTTSVQQTSLSCPLTTNVYLHIQLYLQIDVFLLLADVKLA